MFEQTKAIILWGYIEPIRFSLFGRNPTHSSFSYLEWARYEKFPW